MESLTGNVQRVFPRPPTRDNALGRLSSAGLIMTMDGNNIVTIDFSTVGMGQAYVEPYVAELRENEHVESCARSGAVLTVTCKKGTYIEEIARNVEGKARHLNDVLGQKLEGAGASASNTPRL